MSALAIVLAGFGLGLIGLALAAGLCAWAFVAGAKRQARTDEELALMVREQETERNP